jgi:hypothetical protein
MIRSMSSDSRWIRVNASPPSLYVGNQQSAGMLRYNTQNNRMEVYDGTNWMDFGGHAEIGLDREAEEIMQWAREKMREDREFEELCRQHPGLQEAYERLQIMKTLVKKEMR